MTAVVVVLTLGIAKGGLAGGIGGLVAVPLMSLTVEPARDGGNDCVRVCEIASYTSGPPLGFS